MADSGDDGVGSGFTIKEIRPEHVEDAGSALFTAFYVDSLATGVPPTYIIASPEEGSSLLESFLPQPRRKSASWSMYAEWYAACLDVVSSKVLISLSSLSEVITVSMIM